MPQLFFRYSEPYDAGLSYWVNALEAEFFHAHYDHWYTDYVLPGQQFAASFQAHWDPINDHIFAAFHRIGFTFPTVWQAYVIHPWPKVLPYKDPLTIFIQDDYEQALNDVIHELTHCHEDYEPNGALYQPVLAHIKACFPQEPPAVQYHLITNLIQWSVQRAVFPNQWMEYHARTLGNAYFQRVADIIDREAESIDYDHPLQSLLHL